METKQQTLTIPLPPLPQWNFQQPSTDLGLNLQQPPAVLSQRDQVLQAIAILESAGISLPRQQQAIALPRAAQMSQLPLMLLGGMLGMVGMTACLAVIMNSLPNAQVSATQQAQLQMLEQVAKRPPQNICIAFSCPAPVVQQPVQYAAPHAQEFVPVVGQPVNPSY